MNTTSTMGSILRPTAIAGLALVLCAPTPTASAGPSPVASTRVGVAAAVLGDVTATGMSEIVDVSRTGRYALGMRNGRYVVRDLVRERTVRKLPSSSRYSYEGISDTGRYVLYTRTRAGAPTQCDTPWVRDRRTNIARNAATTKKGRPLRAKWAPTATECPDEPSWRTQITFSEPALSGNGRYVAFCVNLKVANRLDLYVKDMRTKRIRTWPGACSQAIDAYERPQPPQISETGRVVLLPGFHATGDEAGNQAWEPASLLKKRSSFVGRVGGAWPVLTDDGRAVYSIGPVDCHSGPTLCPGGPMRHDVASGTSVTLPIWDPGPGPMSRRGRYVLVIDSPDGVVNSLHVLDRTLWMHTDLTDQFAAAGLSVPGRSSSTLLSGNGRLVFLVPEGSDTQWYRMPWM